MHIVLCISLVIAGIIMIIKPEQYFDITEGWKSETSSEPSRLYLFFVRFCGVLCLLCGIVLSIVLLVF